MKEWIIFVLFLLVGLGMLVMGIFYMHKEKGDPESVKIYRIVSVIGAMIAVAAAFIKFVF
ncbi:MAG: hypothetical protein LBS36_06505 [Oscillospiraceae bacterium]|nr:hypothetical protein [Oscillospiraceae bacterium]